MRHTKWKDPIAERYNNGIRTLTVICLRNLSADPTVDRTRREAAETGAECVERLLDAKQVIWHTSEKDDRYNWGACPVCGRHLRKDQQAAHCPACGQLLNWEE